MRNRISVEVLVNKPLMVAYSAYNDPKHVVKWNFATSDWTSPSAKNDLRVGGEFKYRMEAKDGSMGFDFEGKYLKVTKDQIRYIMPDGRVVDVDFHEHDKHTHVTVVFDPEEAHSKEEQRKGWQSILNNYKKYADSL